MDNPLLAFLEESNAAIESLSKQCADVEQEISSDAVPSQAIEATDAKTVPSEGILLLSGCVDWDCMTSAKPVSYEIPHVIQLPHPVSRVYSTSSSCKLLYILIFITKFR
jgi:hypothetical protein